MVTLIEAATADWQVWVGDSLAAGRSSESLDDKWGWRRAIYSDQEIGRASPEDSLRSVRFRVESRMGSEFIAIEGDSASLRI